MLLKNSSARRRLIEHYLNLLRNLFESSKIQKCQSLSLRGAPATAFTVRGLSALDGATRNL
jgi:hypothetical protein